MKIRKSVKKAMEQLHIKELRKNQVKPINAILDGHDTMVIGPTSYGKSLIYQIPAVISKDTLTIVIEPLLALNHDQVWKLQNHDISADYLDSTLSPWDEEDVWNDLYNGEIQILYLAPEQLKKDTLSAIEEDIKIGMIVIDECHCVTAWGYTFRESYLKIGKYIDKLKHRPVVVALSATAQPEDRPKIMQVLSMRDVKTFEMSLYRSNLHFMKRMTPSRKEKLEELKRCLKNYRIHKTIVFCNTINHTEAVARELRRTYKYGVIVYHGQKKDQEEEMMSLGRHIIVATSALSMGVDIQNVDLVIHYDMPMSLADYYQMAGRAGREGQEARSILLYDPADYRTNAALLKDVKGKAVKKTMLARLDEMKEFCEDEEHCMVQRLLQSLGDPYDHKCRYCTNCQKER